MYSIANDNIYRDYIIEKSTSYNKKKERKKVAPSKDETHSLRITLLFISTAR